ncbi:hypothetical protein LSM04_006967 [Trypanosoma melophagium]|uniref:uncharacterized protein n=2 Tax=Trypanosoma melophagium TaxID=715481 RepID=UPI00351A6CBF|nr:hypothetical protein LSM04_006967 [Trypanosoma melophagium]
MHRLLCTALLLLCCVYGCIATDVVQTLPQKGQGPWDAYTVAVSVPDPGAALEEKKRGFKPIRFAVSAKEIDRVLSYCKRLRNDSLAENEDDEISGFKLEIEEKLCVMSTRITPERRKTLLREVLPAALKLHSERLSVEHVEGTLNLSFNGSPPFLTDCPHASIPKKHLKGISDADFMLYVGVTESYKPVQICSKNTKGRPTSALIRFIPKEIDATRHFIRYAAHEIAHALGFEIETMKKHNIIKEEKSDRKTVRLVTSKTVLEKMKDQYGCLNEDEIKKVAFENDLPEGAPLHWERRIAKDELMSKYTIDLDVTGAYYSTLTLAIFDSMPFYSANFKMAESMSWGKDAGCN